MSNDFNQFVFDSCKIRTYAINYRSKSKSEQKVSHNGQRTVKKLEKITILGVCFLKSTCFISDFIDFLMKSKNFKKKCDIFLSKNHAKCRSIALEQPFTGFSNFDIILYYLYLLEIFLILCILSIIITFDLSSNKYLKNFPCEV